MSNLAFIQWMQLADAIAWSVPLVVFMSSVLRVWRGRSSPIDVMMSPIFFIAVNRVWASAAWLIYPRAAFVTNEHTLWTAVHVFSIVCVVIVMVAHRQAKKRLL